MSSRSYVLGSVNCPEGRAESHCLSSNIGASIVATYGLESEVWGQDPKATARSMPQLWQVVTVSLGLKVVAFREKTRPKVDIKCCAL